MWSHRTRGDTEAPSSGGLGASVTWRRKSLPAQGVGLEPRGMWPRGDSGALSCRVMGSVPRGTWQHQSPFLAGGAHGASGHVVTPEPFLGRWRALCHGARGDTEALFWRVACSMPRSTWRSQSSLAPGTDLEPWG
jgi:hypothetical protein